MPDTPRIKRYEDYEDGDVTAMLNDLAAHIERLERQQRTTVHFLKLGGVSEHDLYQEMNRQLFGTDNAPQVSGPIPGPKGGASDSHDSAGDPAPEGPLHEAQ